MIGRTKRFLAEKMALMNKANFNSWQKSQSQNFFHNKNSVTHFKVVSFSGSKFLMDQLLSIYSFYLNVGIPNEWTIFSDGSYSKEEIERLTALPNVRVETSNIRDILSKEIMNQRPTLKKIFIYEEVEINNTTIFVDSDVLFYPTFKGFIPEFNMHNWYIVDEGTGYFDPDFKNDYSRPPLNLGLLILNSKPNWDLARNYIYQKIESGQISYWSDQTACHVMASKSDDFKSLPREKFVVGGTDAFALNHCVDYNLIAVRHFVGPVRHKMWQYPWRKSLNFK